MKRALVCGAGGFIGGHLVERLKSEGYWVRGVDIKLSAYGHRGEDDFVQGDLRDPVVAAAVVQGIDEVYQLAADMGGAGYIFTGENDAHVMHNSALCNLHVLEACRVHGVPRIFYSSSACMYPEYNQLDPKNPNCTEESAYPAQPDSEYGWEKLFSERLYASYQRNYGIQVRIGRYHNIYGPKGTWDGGREKAPAALCRKVAMAEDVIEVWGDGQQTRSFLYIDACVEATWRLMRSGYAEPVNIGSTQQVTINELAGLVMEAAGKRLEIRNIPGPTGVRGRNSDNTLIQEKLGWAPAFDLLEGIEKTYQWVSEMLQKKPQRLVT